MSDSFLDNWTYLRTELNWLDRVLASAIARQRKESKEIERVSKARIDQITSHWWKGIIQVDGTVAGDSPADLPRRSQTKVNYQQQMEARIQASQTQGIVLGLPSLCQKLELSLFEKNAVLLALAPEVSRRYGRIYNFLQETDHPGASGLPTIDLMLRLLCRNDSEWRLARQSLSQHAKLLRYGVVVLPQSATEPFLSHPVKLTDAIAEYLLADTPQLATLDQLLTFSSQVECRPSQPDNWPETWHPEQLLDAASMSATAAILSRPLPTNDLWDQLVLPKQLRADLQHLSDRLRYAQQLKEIWQVQGVAQSVHCGTVALFVGATGTGKTLAAQAMSQSVEQPLTQVDLALVEPEHHHAVLQHLTVQSASVLLIKSAQHWLGRSPSLSAATLRQFLQTRRQQPSLTLFSVEQGTQVKTAWKTWLTACLSFPLPNKANRLQLWQRAFPPAALATDINWQELAQLRLTGGMIQAIAQEAMIYALAEQSHDLANKVTLNHIQQACQFLNVRS